MGAILDFLATFTRDYQKYLAIEKEVRVLCEEALRGIQFLWQSRVKAVESLKKKLIDRRENYQGESENVADIVDLVAGRIILADWRDFERVEEIIRQKFIFRRRIQHPKPGQKSMNMNSRFRGYGGRHYHVTRKNAADQYSCNPVIEIQVMTAYMWVYATLAHDIEYKKLHGEPSEDSVLSIEVLKGIANLGEIGLDMFNRQFLPIARLSPQPSDISPSLPKAIQTVGSSVWLDENDKQCIRDLRLTDPRYDKKRIEANKDQLLEGSCSWVLEDQAFIDWWTRDNSRLLWIHGDPGKGKTMMMIALVSEVERKLECLPGPNILTYFFCQKTSSDLNTTVSVLRGLIFLLVDQEKTLIRHLREKYDSAGRRLFEGPNTLYALLDVLLNILMDPSLSSVCLMIDALDECDYKIHELLEWIIDKNPDLSPKIKWLITSRNEPAFTERLGHGKQLHTSLELNSLHVTRAVAIFIDHKIGELASLKKYNGKLQAFIRECLLEKAEGTFLWVALVCKELRRARPGKERSFLQATPAGLVPLYERMLHQVFHQEDEGGVEPCRRILCSVTLAFRPLRLEEIAIFAKVSESELEVLVDFCGSFITVREQIAYLIHSSAKDYLSDNNRGEIFISGQGKEHAETVSLCLEIMSDTLKKDICNLKMPATGLNEIDESRIGSLIPFYAQYACLYWVDHLQKASHIEQESLIIREDCQTMDFFQLHFLHWLETLSLISKLSEAVIAMTSLCSIPQCRMSTDLFSFVQDARRFVLEFRSVVEVTPLQLYNSAPFFSPETSIIKRLFSHQMPKCIRIASKAEKNWTSSLQTLEGHSDIVNTAIYSPDSKMVASASDDGTVKLWDPITGDSRCTLKGDSRYAFRGRTFGIKAVAFSPDGQLLASGSGKIVELWSSTTGQSRGRLEGHTEIVLAVLFSPDGQLLATMSDNVIMLWDPITEDLRGTFRSLILRNPALVFSPDGQLLASTSSDFSIRLWDPIRRISRGTLQSHSHVVNALVFSAEGHLLVSASRDKTVKLWDPTTKEVQFTFEGHLSEVNKVAFSPNGRLLASASDDSTVRLWDPMTKNSLAVFEGHSSTVNTVVFSPNGNLLASASKDKTIKIWDPVAKDLRGSFEGHLSEVNTVIFSNDGLVLASASRDKTVRLWDPIIDDSGITSETNHLDKVNTVVFSPNGRLLASASDDKTIRLWDPITGDLRCKLEGHSAPVKTIAFSPDGQTLASGSGEAFINSDDDCAIRLWDSFTGDLRGKLEGHSDQVKTLAFSPDGQLLASGSDGGLAPRDNVRLWNPTTGELRGILEGHSDPVNIVCFSPDNRFLASASGEADPEFFDFKSSEDCDNTIRLWDSTTGDLDGALEGHSRGIVKVAFSPDGQILASAASDDSVRLWDVRKKTLLQQIQHQYAGNMFFNVVGSRLVVDCRVFEISSASLTALVQERTSTEGSYGLSFDKQWVSWKGQHFLWLPIAYRPSAYAFGANLLVMGSAGGRMTFFALSNVVPPF